MKRTGREGEIVKENKYERMRRALLKLICDML